MYEGMPYTAKSSQKHLITVDEVMSGRAKANGNQDYSSIMVRYLLEVTEASGPLKSILSLLKGDVALISLF